MADNKKILDQVKAVQVLDQHLKKAKLSAEQFASVIKAIELGDISDLSQLEAGLKKLSKTKFKNIERLKQDFSSAFNKSASAELIKYFNTLDTRSEQQIQLLKERNDEYGNFAKRVDLENEKILSQQKEQTEEYEEQFDILEDITKQIESLPDLQKKNLSNSLLVSDAYATQSEKLSESIQELRALPNVFDKIKPSAEYESSLLEPIEKFTNRIKEEFSSGDYTNTRYEFQGEVNLSLADASDKVAAFVNEMQASITDKSAIISATIANLFGDALDPNLVNKYIGSLSDASITLDPTEIDAIKNVISELPEEKQVQLSFGISQAKVAIDELRQLESVLEASTQQLDRLKTVSKPVMSTMQSGVDELVNLMASARGIMPNWIYETLQLSKAFDKVGAAVKTSLENAASALANGASYAQTFDVFTQSLTTEFGALASQAGRFLLIVGGVVIAIASLVALMKSVHGSAKQFSEELGVSRIQGLQLYKQTLDITNAFGNQLTTQEDVLSVLKSHQEAYGNILDLTNESNQEAVRFASSLGKQYGMAAGEVYGIQTAFQELGADQELSQGLTAYLATAADLSGISFKTITKDLVEASEFVTLHFQGMPKQAAKAAVEVRKMGMSLKQLGTVMDKTLDISGFTKDMTELNILTGGSANLSNFFDMRFKGASPEKLAGEIATQYDRMVDSGRANEFTMRKFAETVGMSVDELQKSRLVRQQIGNLTEEQRAALNRHLGDLDEATLKDAARAKEAANQLMTQEKFNASMNKLKGEVMEALLPLIESFGESLSFIIPIISVIGKLLGAVAYAINFILTPVRWLFKLFGAIGEAIMTWSFDPIKDSFGEMGDELLSATKDTLSKIGKLIIGAGVIYAAGFWKPFLGLNKTVLGAIPKGLSKITGMVGKKGGLLGNLSGGSIGKTAAPDVKSIANATKIPEPAPGLGERIKTFLTGLTDGLKHVGANAGTVALGGLALIPAGLGLTAMTPAIPAIALMQMINGKAFAKALIGVGRGIAGFGQLLAGPQGLFLLAGVAAIALLGAALIPLGIAVSYFSVDSAAGLLVAGIGLLGLSSGIMAMAIALPFIIPATVSLLAFGFVLKKVGPWLVEAAPGFSKLAELGNGLVQAGMGLMALGAGIAMLGAGAALLAVFGPIAAVGLTTLAVGVLAAGILVIPAIPGLLALAGVMALLAPSLKKLGEVGPGLMMAGLGLMTLAPALMSLAVSALFAPMALVAVSALAGMLTVLYPALQPFLGVGDDILNIGTGIAALGGGIALLGAGAALIGVFGILFAFGLTQIGMAVIAFGVQLSNPLFYAGIAAIAILSAGLAVAANILKSAAPAFQVLGESGKGMLELGFGLMTLAMASIPLALAGPALAMFSVYLMGFSAGLSAITAANPSATIELLTQIANISTSLDVLKLMALGPALMSVSAGLAAFGLSSAIGGLGSAIGKFFGYDPIEKFERLAAVADPLLRFAEALERIAGINQIQLPEISGVSKFVQQTSNNATSLPKNDLSVAEPSMKLTESQTTTSSTNTQNYTNTATTSGGDKQLYNALMQVANRPVIVKIGDLELKTLNKKMKRFNNNSQ